MDKNHTNSMFEYIKKNLEDIVLICVYAITILYFGFIAPELEDSTLQTTREIIIALSGIGAFGTQLLGNNSDTEQSLAVVTHCIGNQNIKNVRRNLYKKLLVIAIALLSPICRCFYGVTDSSALWNWIFNMIGAFLVCLLLFNLLPDLNIEKIVNKNECVSAEWIVLSIAGVLATEYQSKENEYTEVPSVASTLNALCITFVFLVLFMSISCVVTQILTERTIDTRLKKPLIIAVILMAVFCIIYVLFNSYFQSFLFVLFLCAIIAIWFMLIVALLYWKSGKYVLLLSTVFCLGFPVLIYFAMKRAIFYWDSLSTYLLIAFSMCVSFFPLYFVRKNGKKLVCR